MPRRERPIAGENGALSQFAGDLRRLREQAGSPTYRELSKRAHYSPAALSEAAAGRKLPTLAVTLAYVGACHGDVDGWETRWREIAADEREEIVATDSPYVGLRAFQPEDVDRFFGREQLTDELEEAVRGHRFVGVFGASGSGKSSLLRAGLVPRLDVPSLVFAPTARPVEECAVRLGALVSESAVVLKREFDVDPANLFLRVRQWNPDLVLVVDQFEEVFTLASPDERAWLVTALTSGPHVVIGVRSDFYGHCARHPELVDALRSSQVMVGPMTPDELRRAITEPAARAGAKVETALVARLVADVAGQPAALPLVSHALVETWSRRRGLALSLAAYEEAGGLEHAVARTAETLFSSFAEDEQRAARLVFLRLIALGEGADDTKRRVPRDELEVDASLLDRLAQARLITLDRDCAELTHEALIRSWPRLRDWIAQDRERLRAHRQLVDAMTVWEADGRDPDALYRGVRLAQANALGELIGWREREFLDASVHLELRNATIGRRRAHRLRQAVAVLVVLVMVLAGTAIYAFNAKLAATNAANNAMSHRGAVEAMVMLGSLPHQAAIAALASYSIAPTDASRNAVLSSYAASLRAMPGATEPPGEGEGGGFLAPGGKLFIGRDNNGLFRLWSVSGYTYTAHGALGPAGRDAVFSEDARHVAVNDEQSFVTRIWDISDLDHPRQVYTSPGPLLVREINMALQLLVTNRVGLEADGKVGYLASQDRLMGLSGEIVVPGDGVKRVTLRSDGLVAVLRQTSHGTGLAVELMRLDDRRELRGVHTFDVTRVFNPVVRFSPSGRFLAVWADNEIEIWDLSTVDKPMRLVAERQVLGRDVTPSAFSFGADEWTFAVAAKGMVRAFRFDGGGSVEELGTVTTTFPDVTRLTHQEARVFVAQGATSDLVRINVDLDDVVRRMCENSFHYVSDSDWRRLFPEAEPRSVCR